MSWTPQLQDLAHREGWGVFTVIDARTGTVTDQLLPLTFGQPFAHAGAALRHVMQRAQHQSELHIQALRTVVASARKARPGRRRRS